MKYTLEQCIEQQKKVDASIKHNGEYMPRLAASAEVIEKLDHLSMISTWKKQPAPDLKQAFMEGVDVFAFIMSAAIQEGIAYTLKDYVKYLPHYEGGFSIGRLFSELLSFLNDFYKRSLLEAMAILVVINDRLYSKTAEDLFYYYMGKQALTQFRQANGYKTGDYIKNWAGKEDNEHLTEMLENGVSIEYLPTALEDAYSLVIKHA
jgi:hypothetical protein